MPVIEKIDETAADKSISYFCPCHCVVTTRRRTGIRIGHPRADHADYDGPRSVGLSLIATHRMLIPSKTKATQRGVPHSRGVRIRPTASTLRGLEGVHWSMEYFCALLGHGVEDGEPVYEISERSYG